MVDDVVIIVLTCEPTVFLDVVGPVIIVIPVVVVTGVVYFTVVVTISVVGGVVV